MDFRWTAFYESTLDSMPGLLWNDTPIGYARLALERGVDRYPDGLTYGIPEGLDTLAVGDRVVAPLGRGNTPTSGYIIEMVEKETLDEAMADRIKLIHDRDPSGARLPRDVLELARWISSYYVCPIGVTLAGILPAAVKRGVGRVTRSWIDLNPDPTDQKTTSRQQASVMEYMRGLDPEQRPVELNELARQLGLGTTGPIKKLLEKGLLLQDRRTGIHANAPGSLSSRTVQVEPTSEQLVVINDVLEVLDKGFSQHLLFGVTGSGKTEVYMRLIESVINRGQCALVLVPEISLTPQTASRLSGRFPGTEVAMLHSGLTAAQRNHQWNLVCQGQCGIVLGARSAVFAPIPDGQLGLVIVDEEHDNSYKQDQAPRYNGRDVAIRRAQLADCPIVLGSATPSMESWFNSVARKRSTLHRLRHRAPGLTSPRVDIIDMTRQRRLMEDPQDQISAPLSEAIGQVLAEDAQVLLLQNRRGYASYIACPDRNCGWIDTCEHCDASLVCHSSTLGRSLKHLRCHHCQKQQLARKTCPNCNRTVVMLGSGTQRIEEEVRRRWPHLQEDAVQRLDSDTTRGNDRLHRILEEFGTGRIRILLGTQMIAKGLDYPGVRLVGVINADTALNVPDFRSSERTYALLAQVTGRCGRGLDQSTALIQTYKPDSRAIRLAAAGAFEEFAREELADRAAFELPPCRRMARIVAREADETNALTLAERIHGGLQSLVGRYPDMLLTPPMPCPIARIAGRYRFQVELTAPDAPSLSAMIAAARSMEIILPSENIVVDVDPVSLL